MFVSEDGVQIGFVFWVFFQDFDIDDLIVVKYYVMYIIKFFFFFEEQFNKMFNCI